MPAHAILPLNETLVAGGTKNTASDSGPIGNFSSTRSLRLHLIVSARSGTTPGQNVYVEDSMDGGTTWSQVAQFTALSATVPAAVPGAVGLNLSRPYGDTIRVRWDAPTGTSPSFSWSVVANSEPL